MAILRFKALDEMSKREPVKADLPDKKISDYFGADVFDREKMRQYIPKRSLRKPLHRCRRRTADRPQDRQPGRPGDENVGHGKRSNPLFALVPAAERLHRRETQCLLRTDVRRRIVRSVQRRAARTAGTRRIEFPDRRPPQHVRSARLFGLGPFVARVHSRPDTLYPQHIHRLHRRSARLQNAAAQVAAGH